MYFEVDMRRIVVVEPQELGDAMQTQRAMLRRLLKDVEDEQGSEEHGFYVAVTTLESVSEGRIRAGTGSVVFRVNFKCIVSRLVRNEVVEVVVTKVMSTGFFADCGPAIIYVPRKEMHGFEFRSGPSPEFNTWRDSTGSLIALDNMVRLKVVGLRWEPRYRSFNIAGTLNGDLLGQIQVMELNYSWSAYYVAKTICNIRFCNRGLECILPGMSR